jgi:hypothetical protein
MKTTIAAWLSLGIALASSQGLAITISNPPGNIVQNWTFQNYDLSDWVGLQGVAGDPLAPNGHFGLSGDVYQDLTTIPGQQYSLDFWLAADLYFAPSVTIAVNLNEQTLLSFTTPPYTYDPQVNRSDQMRWAEYTSTFTASASTTRLEFVGNVYDFGFTAVSVVPVPEPTSMTLLFAGLATIIGVRRIRSA